MFNVVRKNTKNRKMGFFAEFDFDSDLCLELRVMSY